MKQTIHISQEDCRFIFMSFRENEYQRENTGYIPVWDTQTGIFLYIVDGTHGPDCNCADCRSLPFEKRCQILAEIGRLDDLLECSKLDGWEMPTIEQIPEPPRYVEIPHVTHRQEHIWIEELTGESGSVGELIRKYNVNLEEFIHERIIDWLQKIGDERDIKYEFDPVWLNPY